MRVNKNKSSENFLVFTLILLLGMFIFREQLKFGLAGDELRTLLLLKSNLSSISINSVFSLIPFGGSPIIILLIYSVFGYVPFWYYFAALLLRSLASFSLFLFGKRVMKSKSIGLTSAFIFIASYAGSESSAPANMGTYFSIFLFVYGLIYLFKYFSGPKNKIFDTNIKKAFFWLTLALVFNAVRMHGLIFLIPLILLFSAFLKINKPIYTVIQISLFILIVFIIKLIGFLGTAGTSSEVSRSILSFTFLKNPKSMIILSDDLLTAFYRMIFTPEINPLNRIIFYFYQFNEPKSLFITVSLVIFVIILVSVIRINKRNKTEALVLLSLLAWPFCFILVPHLAWPNAQFNLIVRYLTVSIAGICILISYIGLKLSQNIIHLFSSAFPKFKSTIVLTICFVLVLILFLIIKINAYATYNHFKTDGERGLYRKYIDSSFQIMNSEIGDRNDKNKPIVFLSSDNTDFTQQAIVEGGEERFSLINNNLSENIRPFYVTSFSYLSDIYCRQIRFPGTELNDIFAFGIKNKQIHVESDEIRKLLLNACN